MRPTDNDSGSGHVHGLSVQLDDGTWVPLDAVIAEGRRQRAREFRRLARLAVHWIARTAKTLVSLVPAHESKRKVPLTVRLAGRLAAGTEVASFRNDAMLGHAVGTSAEGIAGKVRKDDGQPLAA